MDWADLAAQAKAGGSGGATGGMYGAPQGPRNTGSGSFGGFEQTPMVYMGKDREHYYPGSFTAANEQAGNVRSSIGGKDYVPADEAAGRWYDLDEEERSEWAQYLITIGAIDPEDATDFDTLQAFWDKGVELASAYTARGKDITPKEALATYVGWDGSGQSAAARARAAAAAENAPFTGTRTSRSESINLSDPASAKALANYTLTQALGREALPEELEAYRAALNSYESENPSVSTTTATYEEGIQTDQKTTTQGGATAQGAQQTLQDLAREEEDFAEYQAAGPVWNAFMAALASPIQM
jgi:hypothetical protein